MKSAAQTWPPSSQNHGKGEKQNPSASVYCTQEDQENLLAQFKDSRGLFSLFFHPTSETIRPGDMKGPESEPKRDHLNNCETDKIHFATLENLQVIVYLYYYFFIIFTFILLVFLISLLSVKFCVCVCVCVCV